MYTARQWLILEILCALSVVSFIACVTATYYNPDILNKGLWALLLFAILCNLYIGNALERVCRETRKLEKAQRAATPPWAEAEVGGG